MKRVFGFRGLYDVFRNHIASPAMDMQHLRVSGVSLHILADPSVLMLSPISTMYWNKIWERV